MMNVISQREEYQTPPSPEPSSTGGGLVVSPTMDTDTNFRMSASALYQPGRSRTISTAGTTAASSRTGKKMIQNDDDDLKKKTRNDGETMTNNKNTSYLNNDTPPSPSSPSPHSGSNLLATPSPGARGRVVSSRGMDDGLEARTPPRLRLCEDGPGPGSPGGGVRVPAIESLGGSTNERTSSATIMTTTTRGGRYRRKMDDKMTGSDHRPKNNTSGNDTVGMVLTSSHIASDCESRPAPAKRGVAELPSFGSSQQSGSLVGGTADTPDWEDMPGAVAMDPHGEVRVLQKARLDAAGGARVDPLHDATPVDNRPHLGMVSEQDEFQIQEQQNQQHQQEFHQSPHETNVFPPKDDSIKGNNTKKRYIYGGAVLFLVLIAIGVGVGMALGGGGSDSDGNGNEGTTNQPETSPPSTSITSLEDKERAILAHQLSYLSSDASVLEDPNSPQGRALEWILLDRQQDTQPPTTTRTTSSASTTTTNEDNELSSTLLPLNRTTTTEEVRYALSVLYYATKGKEQWYNKLNFISTTHHECDWFGVFCNGEHEIVALNLEENGLFGRLPEEIVALSKTLNHINFHDNSLTGALPSSLGLLSQLTFLDLGLNILESTIPSQWSMLHNLERLFLNENTLTGRIDHIASSWTSLLSLHLGENLGFTGTMDFLEALPQLQILSLYENFFTGSIPTTTTGTTATTVTTRAAVTSTSQLEVLDLAGNQLTGTIPSNLATLHPSLTHILLDVNLLTGTFPFSSIIESNTPSRMTHIQCSGNLFFDSWQDYDTFGSLSDTLKYMSFDFLTGTLPDAIGEWTQLTELSLGNSMDLTGTLPASLANWTKLVALKMTTTALSGSLPTELIASWTNLQELVLQGNYFSGSLPSNIGSLQSLSVLNLEYNRFSGTLPPELSYLDKLTEFDACANDFSGDLGPIFCTPGGGIVSPELTILQSDCGEVPHKIDCECCTRCCPTNGYRG